MVAHLTGCSDECSSPRDCPGNQTCIAGSCSGVRDANVDLRERPTVPEVELGPTQDAEAGTPDPDAGDAAADADVGPGSNAELVGQIFVRQFSQSQLTFESELGGRILDRTNAGTTQTTTEVGGCRLIETTYARAPIGVQVGGAEITISQEATNAYTLTSLVDGTLRDPVNLPNAIFVTAQRGTVSFSFDGGSGTGRPGSFERNVSGPSAFSALTPSPLAPLSIAGGVAFTFTPLPIAGDVLQLAVRDTRRDDDLDQVELICAPSALVGGTYTLSPVAVQAFFDAEPEGDVTLTFGYREAEAEVVNVNGGGEARIDLEVLRGARWSVIVPE